MLYCCLVLGLCCVNSASGLAVEVAWLTLNQLSSIFVSQFLLLSECLSHSFSRARLMREKVVFGEFYVTGPQALEPEMEMS